MSAESTMRDSLNSGDPNRIADVFRKIGFGDLLNALVSALSATETGLSASTNVVTLANQPSFLPSKVNATAGTTTGVKTVRQGAISGPNAVAPVTGECVWDGGKKILFAAVDAVTTASVTYTKSADTSASNLSQALEPSV